jgi:large subunit ribosomal protein L22
MNYSIQEMKENMAKAYGRSLGISTKVSIEIANHLRGRTTTKAKWILEKVLEKKEAIPFKRFTDGVGHRPGGIGAGRYPQKASEEFLKLIKQAEANAIAKGLSEDLVIVHLAAHKASSQFRQGRQRRRKFKKSHLEIAVQEMEKETKQKTKPANEDKK